MNTQLQRQHPYLKDVTDASRAFVATYLTLMTEDALPRHNDLREVVNALRRLFQAGESWRLLPHDSPR
jgi:transposase